MTDTLNPAVAAMVTADDVKRMLAQGLTVKEVAERSQWPRQSVTAVINGVKGWLLDPHTDKAYQPGTKQLLPQLPEGVPEVVAPSAGFERPPAAVKAEGDRLAAEILARPAPAPAEPLAPKPDKLLSAIATILGLLDSHDDPAVTKDVKRAREALAKLRGTLAGAEERRAAEQALADAKQAVAEATERLRALKTGKPAPAPVAAPMPDPASSDVDRNRAIRAWAAANKIECRPLGRIPKAVQQQYDNRNQEGTPA